VTSTEIRGVIPQESLILRKHIIKMHNVSIRNLILPRSIRVIETSRMKWAGHVRTEEELINIYKICIMYQKNRRDH
jgi:hypothetical protein